MVIAGPKLVIAKFRQLCGSEHGRVTHQKGRINLLVTMFAGMQIDHELTESTLEPGKATAQDDEARPRQLGRGIEIHQAQTLAEGKNVPSDKALGEFGFLPYAPDFHIAMLVGTHRHIIEGLIGNLRQGLGQGPRTRPVRPPRAR